ncbi:putative aldouronate transport system permease protein [Gracilibacillus halotolerans]|uniref:Putative aldouronate transport system permease protein n=1 Tax=Gracilibacillus halotolerans TaxID=74386 RepID=A0A841RHM3_9BACI|nr:ABC transporter permease subunit [Gracilibacillus halotolerans]MBB6513680.1 putative aldouronate transport system permease protein [Gracilibacillus halotolerans]
MATVQDTKVKVEPKVKKQTVFNTLARDYQLWIMILPAIICVIIFNYVPMYGIQLAFREYDFTAGLTGGDFVGLKYFEQFMNSHLFWDLIRNTLLISITTIVVGFPAPIALALLVNQIKWKRGKRILQTTVYLPHFISIVVLVGLLNVMLSPNTGILGLLLAKLGVEGNLLASVNAFVPIYVLSDVWQHVGWNSIIYLAALAAVDPQLYDAAKIDGANKWQIIRNVEIPAIIPTIIILLILNMGSIISTGFEKIFLMQNSLNLPISEVIETYVYKTGIVSNQFSYAAAIGLFNTMINFTMLVIVNTIAKKVSRISLW